MIYDYSITTGKGEELNLSDYKGKVIMVVNTATGCGFTPQYEPIEQMYRDYHAQGLEIDYPDWKEDVVAERVREACEKYGRFGKAYIPCASQGLPMSTFPGVYEATSKYIDAMSREMFPRK